MHDGAESFGGRREQHIFNQSPCRAVVHQPIGVFKPVFLFEIRQDYARAFFNHAALARIGDFKHFLLRRFRLVDAAVIGLYELRHVRNDVFVRKRNKLPSSLMI